MGDFPAIGRTVSGLEGDGVKGANHGAHCAGLAAGRVDEDGAGFRIPTQGSRGAGTETVRRVAVAAGEGKCLVFDAEHANVDLGLPVTQGADQGSGGVVPYGAGRFAGLAGQALLVVNEYSFHKSISVIQAAGAEEQLQ